MLVNKSIDLNINQTFDFTIPKQVWESFPYLQRGYGSEFLTTNVTKKFINKITLFKYIDEAIRISVAGKQAIYHSWLSTLSRSF